VVTVKHDLVGVQFGFRYWFLRPVALWFGRQGVDYFSHNQDMSWVSHWVQFVFRCWLGPATLWFGRRVVDSKTGDTTYLTVGISRVAVPLISFPRDEVSEMPSQYFNPLSSIIYHFHDFLHFPPWSIACWQHFKSRFVFDEARESAVPVLGPFQSLMCHGEDYPKMSNKECPRCQEMSHRTRISCSLLFCYSNVRLL
jgi:hypothetical protein